MIKGKPGLVSVTFRRETPEVILDWAAQAGLEGIEWGGDLHVPVGALETARSVGRRTRDCGMAILAYGSYYRAGLTDQEAQSRKIRSNPDFSAVLATAETLGARNIRIWAHSMSSAAADESVWQRTLDDLDRIRNQAAASGVSISLEYHNNTLNDRPHSTRRIMQNLAGTWPVLTLWQPLNELSRAENLATLQEALPSLAHVHVFSDQGSSSLLETAAENWRLYLDLLFKGCRQQEQLGRGHAEVSCWLLLEFVKEDSRQSLIRDAATLTAWISRLSK